MWNNISMPWQRAFELAWNSYKNDTIPIGAIILDDEGNIIAEGRNRIFDTSSTNPLAGTYMAHAEMTAMMQLKTDEHPNIRDYHLYTTMEPCPMCFGTMLMVHICNLHFGARDGFAGATKMKESITYTKNKKMIIKQARKEVEVFQLILQSSFESIRNHPRINEIFDTWRLIDNESVELGIVLHEEGFFNKAISNELPISKIYNYVMNRYNEFALDKRALIV